MTERVSDVAELKNFDGAGHGLAGWLMEAWRRRRPMRERVGKTLQVVETLPLGARRQLVLVRCGEEYFLVGGGLEGIQAIVKVDAASLPQEAKRCE